jgi:hypothetical protein
MYLVTKRISRAHAEPYQGVQQERQKKSDAQNEYLQNFGSNLKNL